MNENGSWSRVSHGYVTGQNLIQLKFLNFNLNSTGTKGNSFILAMFVVVVQILC